MSGPPTGPRPTERARVVWEVLAVFGGVALLTGLIVALGERIRLLGENALALVALVFLYTPIVILRRRRLDPGRFGLDREHLLRGLGFGLLITCVTLPPFLAGFHIWETTVFDHELDPALGNYRSFPDRLRAQPSDSSEDGLYIWREQRYLHLRWIGDGPWDLTVGCDCELIHRAGPRPRETVGPGTSQWHIVTPSGGHELILAARAGRSVSIRAERSGEPLVARDVWMAGDFVESLDGPVIELTKGLGWIALSVLIQILLVALPEEFFYRGYVQTRLDSVLGGRWRLGPLHTSPAILLTSVLFALGHYLIGFDPQRLAVFFPALAFGWIRDRTDGLGGCILYHAACNLMVELTVVHYWPAG